MAFNTSFWRRVDRVICCVIASVIYPALLAPETPKPGQPQQAFLFTLLLFGAFLLLSELKKPQLENARPSGLGDFNVPTTTQGRFIPVFWGRCRFDGPNTDWYGDFKRRAITQNVKTGLFSSATQTVGFRYFLGLQFGWARGDASVLLKRLWIGDDTVFTGSQGAGSIAISEPNLFGGNEFGQGGLSGTLSIHVGDEVQTADTYLSDFQKEPPVTGDTPAYRGTVYTVFERGYIGNSTNLRTWSAEWERIPNGLGLSAANATVNDGDANPMSVLYEAMTNDEWGLNRSPSIINATNLSDAAAILKAEGNGFSMILDNASDAQTIIEEIERQVDGLVYQNITTGLWEVTLVRPGAAIAAVFNESNVVKVSRFGRSTWEETTNQIRLKFPNRASQYQDDWAEAHDMANVRIQGSNQGTIETYPGIKDGDLANRIVWRDQATLSTPLSKVRLTVNRLGFDLNPGDLVTWSHAVLGIVALPMRVNQINLGDLTDGRIVLDLVEDVFNNNAGSFVAPPATGWVVPTDTVVDIPADDRVVIESPKAIVDRSPIAPGVGPRVFAGIRTAGNGEVETDMIVAGVVEATIVGFMLVGKLNAAVTRESTATISIKPDPDTQAEVLEQFELISNTDRGVSLSQLVLVNDEFISIGNAAANAANTDLLTPVRAMLDSVAAEHAVDDLVYLVFIAAGISDSSFTGASVSVKLIPVSPTDRLLDGSATDIVVTLNQRHLLPYPPVRPTITGVAFSTTTSVDVAVGAGDDGKGFNVDWTRRDFQTSDEYLAQLTEATLPTSFETINTTEHRIEVIDDPDGTPTSLFFTAWAAADGTTTEIGRTELLANNSNVLPSRVRVSVETRHTFNAVLRTAQQKMTWDFDLTSPELDGGDTSLGVLAQNAISSTFTATAAVLHTLNIGANVITGANLVEARINGGAFFTVISVGLTTGAIGTLAINDTVEIRHNQASTGVNTFVGIDVFGVGDAVEAYGVLQV